jgi:hypothetical protein
MQINPFNTQVVELEATKTAATCRIAELSRLLDWYRDFVPEAANARRLALLRSLAANAQSVKSVEDRLQHLRAATKAAEEQASPGLDPRTWVSSERAIAKRKLAALRDQIAELDIELQTLASPKTEAGEDMHAMAGSLHRDLESYRQFDALQARSEMAMRQHELMQLEPQLIRIRKRKLSLDHELEAPWQSLQARRAKRATIERDLRRVEQFSEQLGAAHANKAAIHQACEREFGDGSPGRVKNGLKGKLRVETSEIAKLEERIADLVRKSQLDVREVIIDGSNMAYHGGDFIGLQALEAIMPQLVAKCRVTVNFDPGFGRKVGMGSRQIRDRFPGAEVHFVPRGMKADPFVLKFVDGKPHAYVISNDNFRDFSDKEAVRQNRILKHAILNGMASIPALDIEASLPKAQQCAPA